MTPVYVSVIYFCIRSLVRHLPNIAEHFNRVFSTCAIRKTKTMGTEWMRAVDCLIFDMVYFQLPPLDVTREILLNIIHTHQIKIRQKKLRNLFTPSAIFFVTEFHVFVIISKATSEVFSSYQRNRTVLSFRERYRPMRKKMATVTAHRELTVSSPWAHGDQNGHSQPWLSRDLGRDWAVTSPWLSRDHTEDAVIELWPRCDWAVT